VTFAPFLIVVPDAGEVRVTEGGAPSTRTAWDFTDSTLPARSVEKNRTVAVAAIDNGETYVGLVTVGMEPSVV
jgi:hypothetical protein